MSTAALCIKTQTLRLLGDGIVEAANWDPAFLTCFGLAFITKLLSVTITVAQVPLLLQLHIINILLHAVTISKEYNIVMFTNKERPQTSQFVLPGVTNL